MSGRQPSYVTLCPLILNVLLTLIHCPYRESQWTDDVRTLHILLLTLFYHPQHNCTVRLAVYSNACHKSSLFDTDMMHKEEIVDRWFSLPLFSFYPIKFFKSFSLRTPSITCVYHPCHGPHCSCD